MSTTMQQFNRNTVDPNQTINVFNNAPIERAKTAKGLGSNEEEMRRTRMLMDKISGKAAIERNTVRPDTAASKTCQPILSEKLIKTVQDKE